MKQLALVVLCLIDVFPSCGKHSRPTQFVAGTVEKPRQIDINVSDQGYTPSSVSGRPGESVRLVFHYDPSARECGREVVVPSTNTKVTLEEKKPAEIALKLPASGEVAWACGMDMLHGKIVVE